MEVGAWWVGGHRTNRTLQNSTQQNKTAIYIVLFIDRNKNKRRNSAKYFSLLFQFFSHPKMLFPFLIGIKGNGKCIEHWDRSWWEGPCRSSFPVCHFWKQKLTKLKTYGSRFISLAAWRKAGEAANEKYSPGEVEGLWQQMNGS